MYHDFKEYHIRDSGFPQNIPAPLSSGKGSGWLGEEQVEKKGNSGAYSP